MTSSVRAFWIEAPGLGRIRQESLRPLGPGDVYVETRYSAVSRGTESLVFHGKVPVNQYARMRCPQQAGEFPAPVKYGYQSVGRVGDGSPELVGRSVFCLYP